MSFSITNSNNGMIVSPDHYLQQNQTGNMGAGIVDSALSNDDFGFSVSDTVEMMVAGKMGALIPELQAQITNTNVQQGALSQFQFTLDVLMQNTIKPLNQKGSLTSYELTNSNPSAVGASISNNGLSGDIDLSIGVQQLAQSQSLTFGGFSSANQTLNAGTINIDFGRYQEDGSFSGNGSKTGISIEIEQGMTLNDLVNTINKGNHGLSASLITHNDGSVELALLSRDTGASNAMQVSTTGDASLSQFNYSGTDTPSVTEARAASDALFTVNGIAMSSDSNKVEDIFGLDLTLSEVTTNDVRLGSTVAPEGVVENVTAFVENYNSLMSLYNSFVDATPSEDFVGSLHGTDIGEEIKDAFNALHSHIFTNGNSLSDLGISRDADGMLSLDADKLTEALKKDPEIAFKILGTNIESSHNGVEVETMGDAISGEHTVVVTRAPEKAQLVGTEVAETLSFAEDKTLSLKVGGKEVEVTITAGDYSQNEMAALINNAMTKAGVVDYKASFDNNALIITSSEYGSLASVEVVADLPELGLSAQKVHGVDISGTINGEAFLGDGAGFESKFDDASKGMVINFDPELLVLNETITISASKGFLDNFENTAKTIDDLLLNEMMANKDKLDASKDDSLLAQLEEMEDKEAYYYEMYYSQYSGVSAALAQMQSTIDMIDMMFNSKD